MNTFFSKITYSITFIAIMLTITGHVHGMEDTEKSIQAEATIHVTLPKNVISKFPELKKLFEKNDFSELKEVKQLVLKEVQQLVDKIEPEAEQLVEKFAKRIKRITQIFIASQIIITPWVLYGLVRSRSPLAFSIIFYMLEGLALIGTAATTALLYKTSLL